DGDAHHQRRRASRQPSGLHRERRHLPAARPQWAIYPKSPHSCPLHRPEAFGPDLRGSPADGVGHRCRETLMPPGRTDTPPPNPPPPPPPSPKRRGGERQPLQPFLLPSRFRGGVGGGVGFQLLKVPARPPRSHQSPLLGIGFRLVMFPSWLNTAGLM